jgi:hypothetical protein
LVSSKAGAVVNWGEGNNISGGAEDTEFAVWVDEDWAAHADKVVVNGAYVKDEGQVVCDRPANGASRSNGMLRIKDKKGRSIDILTVVDSATTVDAAKGWREAIVSGPILIEDGKIVEKGTHDELIRAKGTYYKLVGIQNEALKFRSIGE